jgi:hypothetical protein
MYNTKRDHALLVHPNPQSLFRMDQDGSSEARRPHVHIYIPLIAILIMTINKTPHNERPFKPSKQSDGHRRYVARDVRRTYNARGLYPHVASAFRCCSDELPPGDIILLQDEVVRDAMQMIVYKT